MTFHLKHERVHIAPILHYKMECAAYVRQLFEELQPDCVAVELPETMELQFLHAASRLPDLTLVHAESYFPCEPCDPAFEALRSAQEVQIPAHCIDLDVENYPDLIELLPDSYAISRIGMESYYHHYQKQPKPKVKEDEPRELYMAKRLKELSFSHEKILFVCGMAHADGVMKNLSLEHYPELKHFERRSVELSTMDEETTRQCQGESAWVTLQYEAWRSDPTLKPDRQQWLYQLYRQASEAYMKETGNAFPGYHIRNIMKFVRNYALLTHHLMPDLFQTLTAAKGCVDHNYAYEVWNLATDYESKRRNVDNLPELHLTPDEIWGDSKRIHFHLKQESRKKTLFTQRRKDKSQYKFQPPGPFSICSYPPEDIKIERFGEFLQKKGTQILTEEGSRTIPFSTSIEDGIDTRETIRHWHEKKLYVKSHGRPPGGVGSIVIVFEEDMPKEGKDFLEKYPWHTTWLGEHEQESDMALYATHIASNIVGPGISRCEYGGFMMSYPPRRMMDVWHDPDYAECRSKAEVLLMAAVDYAVKPIVVYVAQKPPRSWMKSFARRFGKKIVYIPIGQLSPVTLNKIRVFHVLDGHDKRDTAGEYII